MGYVNAIAGGLLNKKNTCSFFRLIMANFEITNVTLYENWCSASNLKTLRI